jgi:hypothetical protein
LPTSIHLFSVLIGEVTSLAHNTLQTCSRSKLHIPDTRRNRLSTRHQCPPVWDFIHLLSYFACRQGTHFHSFPPIDESRQISFGIICANGLSGWI